MIMVIEDFNNKTDEEENVQEWLSELRSLGVRAKRHNDLNDSKELEALTGNVKQAFYKEYKKAYLEEEVTAVVFHRQSGNNNNNSIDSDRSISSQMASVRDIC